MDDGTVIVSDCKKSNIAQSYKGQDIMESHNRLLPEGTQYTEDNTLHTDMQIQISIIIQIEKYNTLREIDKYILTD